MLNLCQEQPDPSLCQPPSCLPCSAPSLRKSICSCRELQPGLILLVLQNQLKMDKRS